MSSPGSQLGQSRQPRPEPDSRTAAPVTMIAPRSNSARNVRRRLVAVDLPGHGHSAHRPDHAYWPRENAAAVEIAIRALAPEARVVVGMSLGGLTAIALAARAPDLVRALVLVDVTPGVNEEKASSIVQFINGPESFSSLDEILERTIAFNPTRTESSLRRGVMHNAIEQP